MNVVEFQIEGGITGTASALSLAAAKAHMDEGIRPGRAESANEHLFLRQVLSLRVDGQEVTVGDSEAAQRRCPTLADRVVDILTAAAGAPLIAPASQMTDRLDAETPPAVLRAAGLSREQADGLVAAHRDYALTLIQIKDGERRKIFAGAVRAPDPDEVALVATAYRQKKGLADAMLSLCDACVVWSREPVKDVWERYPAIPLHVVGFQIAELAGGSAELRFRQRP